MVTKDIYKRFYRPQADSSHILLVQRLVIVLICVIALFFVSGNTGSLILSWSFMAMGLRGCTVLFPLMGGMYLRRWLTPAAGIAAALVGPLTNVLWKLLYPAGMDPLYPGLLASLVTLIAVSAFTGGTKQ
jgi:Na+/proline symporter